MLQVIHAGWIIPIRPEKTILKNYSLIVLKSAIHFLADYEPISDTVLFAEAPGQNPVKVDKISYTKLRSGVRLGPNGKEFQPVQA